MHRHTWSVVAVLAVTSLGIWSLWANEAVPVGRRAALAQKQFSEGNVKDAYDSYYALLTDATYDGADADTHLVNATQCLQRLDRVNEADGLLEAIIAAHPGKWRIAQSVAYAYRYIPHHGFIVSGKFERGNHRGGGQYAVAAARDRVRALQLLVEALPRVEADADGPARANFYLALSETLITHQYRQAWRLQELTDLTKLPDPEEGYSYWRGGEQPGAPVDEAGEPIYYTVPESFEKATSDGARWRWALDAAADADAGRTSQTLKMYADFLNEQFGVQTMAQYGAWFGAYRDEGDGQDRPQTFALHTLGDDETIARLATGIKRFKMPDEHNPIRLYRQLADGTDGQAADSLDALATTYENRRQYAKAAEVWRSAIERFGDGPHRKERLAQIVDEWGTFETGTIQPAGRGAELSFRFRNAKSVKFTAHAVKFDLLLSDVKAYLKANPGRIDGQKVQIDNIGYRLVQENERKYLGDQVATWDLAFEPRDNHFDRRQTVTTPLQKAGAYLVTAQVEGGNTARVIVWLADTVLVKKPMGDKQLIYVADAVTGKPVAKANVEFFGYRVRETNVPIFGVRYSTDVIDLPELSNDDGIIQHPLAQNHEEFQWLIIARTADGRLAHLGFTSLWRSSQYDERFDETKCYGITDRPVYRPSQKVQFKFWIRQAKYELKDDERSAFVEREFTVEAFDPQGTSLWKKQIRSDAYAGLSGEIELTSDAKLGQYQLMVHDHGGTSFRVEEYKKPEFEVTVDAPSEPVMLGEKVTAEIEARYYFGAPVTHAKVKYKVLRSKHDAAWYPVGRWDWLYGRGYWWFGYDYRWYPGWNRWGCMRPIGWWWPQSHDPPEVVAEREAEIGPDGKLKIEIDTAAAKEIHGDDDHRYEVTVEVTDASRRTIVGQGQVLVARSPFKVFAWVDRGFYRTGDSIEANFSAHTLDDKPVSGQGKLRLLALTYDAARKPVETPVQEWELATDAEGHARQQIKASAPGQYRLSYELTDAKGHKEEGGYVFTVRGEDFDGAQFRFNDLELVCDKREYAPGETVQVAVNTDRVGSTVLLFVRPANGTYSPPRVLHMTGKSQTAEIPVGMKDMPNFFIEAVTIADGKLHVETKEIVVPPESRVVDVRLSPSQTEYKPGEKAEIKLSLVGPDGKAFVGQTVVAIYDKSVEYISGGSNVPEIKEFFWKWRRHHYPQTESNLNEWFHNLMKEGERAMATIGVFGGTVADDAEVLGLDGRRRSGVALGGMADAASAVPAAPMAASAPTNGAPMSYAAAPAERKRKSDVAKSAAEPGPQQVVQPTVRSNFADTALWIGALETDSDGIAVAKLDMPENLTTWKIRTWAMGAGSAVGESSAEVVTTKKLLVRLQAPRFFVDRDEVVLSANVHNYLKSKKSVQAVLEVDGLRLLPMDESTRTIEVAADGEMRVDWRVRVVGEGPTIVRMKALTDEESDAMEMTFPVYIHGMLKTEAFSGALRPADTVGRVTFDVPEDRRVEQSRLEVRYSPTLAGAMVDALPYLVEYPYGCTEQTLSRFLPTVVTQKVLMQMGLDLNDIRTKRTNLNAQEIGNDRDRAKQWKRYDRNPVFDEAEVERMVKAGVQRLTDMQVSDGGWGWFSGYGEQSYPHTTAYVVHGLQIARQNDVALLPDVLERGVEWLKRYQAEEVQKLKNAATETNPYKRKADNLDAFVFMVLVDADHRNADMLKFLERDRPELSVYALCMYGMALHKLGEADKLADVMQNIGQYVVEDEENQTAYLKMGEGNYWWYWYGSENESMAYYLKLLSRVDPQGRVASRLVKYLLNNRKHGGYWKSTRDTALCIEALADYLKASGEAEPKLKVEVWLDGKFQNSIEITSKNLFRFDNSFVVAGADLTAGRHTLELHKSGGGPLYYNAYLTNFTTEDFITKTGLEVKVERKFYKLERVEAETSVAGSRGQAVKQKVEKYERRELVNLSEIKSGDLVEVELEIESKNDYEYLVFEDMKAAGFEPVDLQSGYNGNGLGAYMELRDERVCFFTRVLPRGKHSVSYRLRAEIPGKFSALPTRASAMYAPELKANSDEMKIGIVD